MKTHLIPSKITGHDGKKANLGKNQMESLQVKNTVTETMNPMNRKYPKYKPERLEF